MHKLKKLRLSRDMVGLNLYRTYGLSFIFRNVGLSAKRVKTDAAFAATRQKAARFAAAARAAGLIYRSLLPRSYQWDGKSCFRKLLSCLVKGIKNEWVPCHPEGLHQARLCTLIAFECPTIEKGMVLTIPPLHPTMDINAPLSATHFKLI